MATRTVAATRRAAEETADILEMGRRPTSAHEVEKAILFRIANGTYVANDRLPTCEQLAAELGVNKNTVNKAYRALSTRGYLRTSAGRGTFVEKRAAPLDPASAVQGVSSLLALVVQEAKLAGVDRDRFLRLVDETTSRFYDRASVRVGFIECNRLDATTLSRDLQVALAHPVEPLMIDEVTADPERYMREFDILSVNLSHLVVVEEGLRQAQRAGKAEIVGLLLPPDPESLTQVARLRPGTKLGVVCDLAGTLQALGGMAAAYNPHARVSGALTDDPKAIRKLARESDVILVTPSAHEQLLRYEPHVPLISVTFRVDDRSVEQLAERLRARLRRDLPAAV